jgi:hypothetical protein
MVVGEYAATLEGRAAFHSSFGGVNDSQEASGTGDVGLRQGEDLY